MTLDQLANMEEKRNGWGALSVAGLCGYAFVYLQALGNQRGTVIEAFGDFAYLFGYLALLVFFIAGPIAFIYHVKAYAVKRRLSTEKNT